MLRAGLKASQMMQNTLDRVVKILDGSTLGHTPGRPAALLFLAALAACMPGAMAQDIMLTIGEGSAAPGATAEVPVELDANGLAPTQMVVFLSYDPEVVTPVASYYEINETDASGNPVLDEDGNTTTVKSPVLLAEDIRFSGKMVDATVFSEGALGIVISGLDDTPLSDGVLFYMALRANPAGDFAASTVLDGVDSTASLELSGESVSSSAAEGTAEPLGVLFTDGDFFINQCTPPSAPRNVSATNDRTGGVLISWDAIEDSPSAEFRVYRAAGVDAAAAVPIGDTWSPATSFVDVTAAAAEPIITEGCIFANEYDVTSYSYWVVARAGEGCESDFSARVTGSRSGQKTASRTASTALGVTPGFVRGGPFLAAQPRSQLAIRLSLTGLFRNIDGDSAWGRLSSETVEMEDVTWVPALDESRQEAGDSVREGWVTMLPPGTWTDGERLTFTVGANDNRGNALPAITREFIVDETLGFGMNPSSDTSLITLEEGAVPVLEEGVGQALRLNPSGVYSEQRLVWIAAPAGVNANRVRLYYFNEGNGDERWYLASQVSGFLADEVQVRDRAGVTELGYLVRHGGIVQLGLNPGSTASASMAPSFGMERHGGAAVLFGMACLLLLGCHMHMARRRARENQ